MRTLFKKCLPIPLILTAALFAGSSTAQAAGPCGGVARGVSVTDYSWGALATYDVGIACDQTVNIALYAWVDNGSGVVKIGRGWVGAQGYAGFTTRGYHLFHTKVVLTLNNGAVWTEGYPGWTGVGTSTVSSRIDSWFAVI